MMSANVDRSAPPSANHLAAARDAIDRWLAAVENYFGLDSSASAAEDNAAHDAVGGARWAAIEAIREAVEAANGPLQSGPYQVPHEFAGVPHEGQLYIVIPCSEVDGLADSFGGFVTIAAVPLASIILSASEG